MAGLISSFYIKYQKERYKKKDKYNLIAFSKGKHDY